ncbi:3'-5' exonuclease [Bradyrhizobium vignae]|uniref:Putative DNA polymerase III, epsilon subunit n=1 Tax=Bradyrhizobium vignae TaxID=1549949 RepID=A0A2U3PUS0_9BRAD|nr:3'-5' exonuclease [Bradyrhizobium vignae]SPP92858.1 putative DNA polymerase III, epsilon subunit [Bradyrhizobium vignae]
MSDEITDPKGRLTEMAALLEATGDYRVLRRLSPSPLSPEPSADPSVRRGIFLDVETTGVDAQSDEIIELAMLSFSYTLDGQILGVCGSFECFRDPGRPIPAPVRSLTGIDDNMVAGKAIDPDRVADFIGPAALIVAHNSNFDRKFCERLFPIFATKAWACSLHEIDWRAEGFANGTKLGNLVGCLGYFFDGHRAINDCQAGIALLSSVLPVGGRTAMAALLESARRPRWRIRASGAPYAHRERLKARGYRWHDGSDGHPRAWFVDVGEDAAEEELAYLRRDIYGRPDAVIPVRRITALERYSVRC